MNIQTMIAEDIAKMSKDDFFEWLAKQMKRNDPNGLYDAEEMSQCLEEVLELLFQWVEDCGGAENCYFWICIAITKLNSFIMKGGE